ncbi:hypothetical protein MKW98_002198, partial [Papaver atlanticum]
EDVWGRTCPEKKKRKKKRSGNTNRLSIVEFDELPSPVFHGCVKHWKCFSKWNPCKGGLDYLQERAGSSIAEAMLSRIAPVCYGDLRSHERVPLLFSVFISSCKKPTSSDNGSGVSVEQEVVGVTEPTLEEETCLPSTSSLHQVYLARRLYCLSVYASKRDFVGWQIEDGIQNTQGITAKWPTRVYYQPLFSQRYVKCCVEWDTKSTFTIC